MTGHHLWVGLVVTALGILIPRVHVLAGDDLQFRYWNKPFVLPHEKVEVHLAIGTDAALVDYFLAYGQSIRLYVGDYVEGEESNPKRYDTVIPLTAADSALSPRAFGFTHGLQKKMAFAVAFDQDGEPIARTNVAYSMLLDQELAALTKHIRAYTEFGESVRDMYRLPIVLPVAKLTNTNYLDSYSIDRAGTEMVTARYKAPFMEVLRLIELDKIDPFGLKLYRVKGPFFDTLARVRNGLLGTEKASFCCASYDPDGHGYFYVSNIDGANKGGWQVHIQHIYTPDDRALPHLRTSLKRNPSNPDYSSVLDTLAFDCEADTRICFQFGAKASGYANPRVVAPAPVNVKGQISRMPTWHGQYLYWSANYKTASGGTGMMIKRAVIKGFDTRTNMLEFGPAEEVVKTKGPGLIGFGEPSLTDNGDLYAAAAYIDPTTGHVNIVPVVLYQR